MIIGAIKEHNKLETRCTLTPTVVKKLSQLGHKILLEEEIGIKSNFYNDEYIKAGAILHSKPEKIYTQCQLLLQINPPKAEIINLLSKKQLLISDFSNFDFSTIISTPQILRLEKVPRLSVAQNIDILSSQHTIRGYMSAMYALFHSKRIAPQLITAATSLKPTSALIIGASITGLQAASVFKRQGCKTTILDINENNKELAQSVGATFAISNNKDDLISLIQNKNFILAAASSNNSSPKVINQELLNHLNSHPVIIDTTQNNIEISKEKQTTKNYLFYRNIKFETLAPTTSSELWANNMLYLITLITSTDNQLDLSTDYIASMLYKG